VADLDDSREMLWGIRVVHFWMNIGSKSACGRSREFGASLKHFCVGTYMIHLDGCRRHVCRGVFLKCSGYGEECQFGLFSVY